MTPPDAYCGVVVFKWNTEVRRCKTNNRVWSETPLNYLEDVRRQYLSGVYMALRVGLLTQSERELTPPRCIGGVESGPFPITRTKRGFSLVSSLFVGPPLDEFTRSAITW